MQARGTPRFAAWARPRPEASGSSEAADSISALTPGPCETGVASHSSPTVLLPRPKEQVAGFEVIECADLDEAVEAASPPPERPNGRD